MTCWADGKKKSQMSTHNPQFKTTSYWRNSLTPKGNTHTITVKRLETHNRFMDLLEEFKLSSDKVFLDDHTGETS